MLGTGRLHPDYNFYDSSGAFVGSEGIESRTGELGARPAWGIQFPSGGQGFKVVPSSQLPFYNTPAGMLHPWAPTDAERAENEASLGETNIEINQAGGWDSEVG